MPADVWVISDFYMSVVVLRHSKLTGAMLFLLVESGQLPKSPALPGASSCSDLLLARTGPI